MWWRELWLSFNYLPITSERLNPNLVKFSIVASEWLFGVFDEDGVNLLDELAFRYKYFTTILKVIINKY